MLTYVLTINMQEYNLLFARLRIHMKSNINLNPLNTCEIMQNICNSYSLQIAPVCEAIQTSTYREVEEINYYPNYFVEIEE